VGHIRYSGKAEINGSKVSKVPVIITNDLKVHRISLRYFMSIRVSSSSNTLLTYARHLNDFFFQIEIDNEGISDDRRKSWEDVDDAWIELYSSELRNRYDHDDNSNNYVSQVLRTVISFLRWASEMGYSRNQIGYCEGSKIRIEKSKKSNAVSHPLVKRLAREKAPSRTAPLNLWIDAVKAHTDILRRDLYTRYELMIDWGVGVGLRAHELCAISINQLPARETAENAIINGKNVFINIVVSKGSKPRRIPVSPFLVKRTWDYIDSERNATIGKIRKRAKKQKIVFVEDSVVFVSDSTGRALNPRTFSNQVRRGWLNAVERGALTEDEVVWAHGLRHRFVTNLLKGLDRYGLENPQEIAKHPARVSQSQTLDTYS
jgi:integrase